MLVTYEDRDFRPVETMELTGGDISLDFVNTATERDKAQPREKLVCYADLVTWAERVGIASSERGRRLRDEAHRHPRRAQDVLEEARRLREAIYRLFATRDAAQDDLDRVGEAAGRAAAERRITPVEGGFDYAWPDSDRLEQLLWPVASSAAELLTSPERDRVKECAADHCNWLFLDQSKNRSRRWCDMKVCGNRAKARRFNERHRGD